VDTTRIDTEWQCRCLSFEFGYFIDQRLYTRAAELFTTDGVFDRLGQILTGRNAIVAALDTRSADLMTRHLSGNIVFTELAVEQARAVVYIELFSGRNDQQGKPADYQTTLVECRDLYRRTPEGWRFAERVARKIFVPIKTIGH
jgi:hypothetical protein